MLGQGEGCVLTKRKVYRTLKVKNERSKRIENPGNVSEWCFIRLTRAGGYFILLLPNNKGWLVKRKTEEGYRLLQAALI